MHLLTWSRQRLLFFFLCASFGAIDLLPRGARAVASETQEAQVEAAFIYQFTNYVEWPDTDKNSNPDKPFVISILGESPVEPGLVEIAKRKTVNGHKIEIRKIETPSRISECRIIFAKVDEEETLKEIIKRAEAHHVLVITRGEGLLEQGAMINFVVEDEKLRFEINRSTIEKAGLHVSSQLLKLARRTE